MDKIIIASTNKKRKILEEFDQETNLQSVKFLSKKELIEKLYFSYDKRSIYYLVKKYHLKVENAIMYLDNLYYIEDKDYHNTKLDFLVKIKRELIAENLLVFDHLFLNLIKDKEIIIYDSFCSKFDYKIISKLNEYGRVTVIEDKVITHPHLIYEFQTIIEEVEYICNYICKLYLDGISLNKIKLINLDDDYKKEFKRFSLLYGLPIDLKETSSIYGSRVVNDFIDLISSLPPYLAIEELTKKYSNNGDKIIIDKIIKILNEYTWYDYDYKDILELLIYDFKTTKMSNPKRDEIVEVIDLDELNEDEIGIIVGFEINSLPKTVKDENYLSDNLLTILNIDTSISQNKINNKLVASKINHHPNLVLSYKLNGSKGECYPSSLIDELKDIDIITNPKSDKLYSNLYMKVKLGKQLDLYLKYGIITDSLKLLFKHYQIPYLDYNHKYKSVGKDKIKDYLKESGITISYSDLDLYMKCSFAYYIKKILKINAYEETFQALIGSYFHHVLELIRNDDFDLEKEKIAFFKKRNLSNKELFLLRKIEKELIKTIEIVKYQESLSTYNNFCFEEKIAFSKNNDIPVIIKGFIDKIMIDTDMTKRLVLIDYKTGSYNNCLNNTIYGLDLQLPMYAYLVKNSEKFKDYQITGFYIAPILIKEDIVKDNTDIDIKRKDNMKLQGFSVDDESALERFDKTYKDSEVIKSMKITSKGFGPYSKIINKEKMDNLIELVGLKIDEMIKGIVDGKFDINPKYLDGRNKACTYCEYKDICYHDYLDNVYLENRDYQEFLGGDNFDKVDR